MLPLIEDQPVVNTHNSTGHSSNIAASPGGHQEQKNAALDLKTLKIVLPKAYSLIINLFSVYFFEYSIIGCFAERIANKIEDKFPDQADDFGVKMYYVILNNCYQIGVFMSRSSLQFFKIRRVYILSVFQAINFVFLFLNTQYLFVYSLWVMCPLLIWVGFMGGASYVNVMHNLLEHKTLKKNEKEAALALSLMFNDTGVLLSSIFALVMDNTLFKSK